MGLVKVTKHQSKVFTLYQDAFSPPIFDCLVVICYQNKWSNDVGWNVLFGRFVSKLNNWTVLLFICNPVTI